MMWRGPGIYLADALRKEDWPQACRGDGRWVMARPIAAPTFKQRCIAAWRVFTGEWDALRWSIEA